MTELQESSSTRWLQRVPALPVRVRVDLAVDRALTELEIMDLLSPYLSQRDKCSLQATCRTVRNEGISSKVFNATLEVEFSDSSRFESFNMWLTPRAEVIRKLDLKWNINGGALPSSMSRLTALKTLSLCGEGGMLPTGFGVFRGLRVLKFLGINFTSISTEIWELDQLRELEITGCGPLKSLPPDISNLQELRRLSLEGFNGRVELPKEIGSLTKLTYLSFDKIQFDEFPSWICQLEGLHTLVLDFYNVSNRRDESTIELPAAISQLTALEKLDLNSLFPHHVLTLPSAIGQLTRLTFLDLGGHKFKSLPPEIGNLFLLNTLSLFCCMELSQLPREIQGLKALRTLHMWLCEKIKSLPDEIGQLTALRNLNLSGCKSLKSLPSTIGLLTNLSMLELGGCSALRSLPIEVINLRKVKSLNVSAVKRLTFS